MVKKLVALGGCALAVGITLVALAFGGTQEWSSNQQNRMSFIVRNTDGTVRTNCVLSRFAVARVNRNTTSISAPSATFRNRTGHYVMSIWTPVPGYYDGYITYSGLTAWDWENRVRQYHVDNVYGDMAKAATALSTGSWTDARAAKLDRLPVATNMSTIVRDSQAALIAVLPNATSVYRIPRNPLLTNDSRLPGTTLATSDEVAKAADWTTGRAAKLDYITGTVALDSTTMKAATFEAYTGRFNYLDVSLSTLATSTQADQIYANTTTIKNNTDVPTSSRSSQSTVNSIKTKTDKLPSSWR